MSYTISSSLGDAPIGYDGSNYNGGLTNNGSARTLGYTNPTTPGYFSSVQNGGMTLDIGFDDTVPTLEDYRLGDGNYANRKLTIVSQVRNKTADTTCLSLTLSAQNTSEAPVTVKEIGLYVYQSPSSNVVNYWILVARSVLDTPVTIGVGETYAFTYSIEI